MPLTPADIHNVAFKKPPIGKRGYDEEEVDAFLDEVERELARLMDENRALRSDIERDGTSGASRTDPDILRDLRTRLEVMQREYLAAQEKARDVQSQLERVRTQGPTSPTSDDPQGVRVLMMAQRTADDHVGDARRESIAIITEARNKGDEITRDAQARAKKLEMEARQRHKEAVEGLTEKRAQLQQQIRELAAFDEDYHARLRQHLMEIFGDMGTVDGDVSNSK